MTLSHDELLRYARHHSLPEVGFEGQEKLKASRVLCIGAGGLGSSLLYYLAAAGIGTIGIVDDDSVDISNLQRQILFDTHDIGSNKAITAKAKLSRLNPHLDIEAHPVALTKENVLDLFNRYDYVADCSDNFSTRYLINDACVHLNKTFVHASVSQFEGFCSVFGAADGPCYRCLYPHEPSTYIPNCAESGVLGVVPGMMGTIQAAELIKLILGIGEPLIRQFFLINLLSFQWNKISIPRDPDCPLCSRQKTFFDFASSQRNCHRTPSTIKQITLQQFQQLKNKDDVFLLDVRELHEYQRANLGAYLIPLRELSDRLSEINSSKPIIVYCETGIRSEQAARKLMEAGFIDVGYLLGGMSGLRGT